MVVKALCRTAWPLRVISCFMFFVFLPEPLSANAHVVDYSRSDLQQAHSISAYLDSHCSDWHPPLRLESASEAGVRLLSNSCGTPGNSSLLALCSSSAPKNWPKTRLRGINTKLVASLQANRSNPGGFLSDEVFQKFVDWKVNVIRVSLGVDRGSVWDPRGKEDVSSIPLSEPLRPYEKHMEGLEVALRLAEKYRVFVVVTAGDVVGRKLDRRSGRKEAARYQETLTEIWKSIATKFGKHRYLLAYDLMNEPMSGDAWEKTIMPALIQTIRNIDKETYIMVEPAGGVKGLKYLKPVNDPKVVYSFHFYVPHGYTHQGFKDRPKGLRYPGNVKSSGSAPGPYWDRDQLKKSVQVARDFQIANGVRIFVGEFSAIRWAPGSAQWLADAISIFEEFGWDWCYHSYGGWNAWNPTFSPDDPVNNEPDGGKVTQNLNVLLKGWSGNEFRN